MSIKETLRQKARNFLGINGLEGQIADLGRPDLKAELNRQALQSSAAFISEYMSKAVALSSNLEVLDFALARTKHEGLFCEFGVYQANTLNHAARKIQSTIYGFDSFEGLPEFWRDGYPAGAFQIGTSKLPKVEKNVELVVGWFNETLPAFVGKHREIVAYLHIDCDLYSSTKTIFEYLGSHIRPGSILVFDEYLNYPGWLEHEHKAFAEFIESSGQKFEYLCYNRYHEQVAVRII